MDSFDEGSGSVTVSCEHGYKSSGPIKEREYTDEQNNCQRIKNDYILLN